MSTEAFAHSMAAPLDTRVGATSMTADAFVGQPIWTVRQALREARRRTDLAFAVLESLLGAEREADVLSLDSIRQVEIAAAVARAVDEDTGTPSGVDFGAASRLLHVVHQVLTDERGRSASPMDDFLMQRDGTN